MQQEILEIIAQIVKYEYYQSEKYLRLDNQLVYWPDVLLSRDWSILKVLSLKRCGINDESINTFSQLNWSKLAYLYICFNEFTNKGMKSLLNCNLKSLKQLWLSNNSIGNLGVTYLIKADLPNLLTLSICQCAIGSHGIKYLTKGKWPVLNLLWLGDEQNQTSNKMQLNGCQILYEGQFKELKSLNICESQPICWINCVLLRTSEAKVYGDGIAISNEQLKKSIIQILHSINSLHK